MRKLSTALLFGVAMSIMGSTASADSSTISASAGPVPVPSVPVEVCVDDDCQTTPALSAVALRVDVTADAEAGVPTITPGVCASGTGVALDIQSGSDDAVVSGEVSGTLPDGSPFSQPIDPVTIGQGTTSVSACTTAAGPLPDPDPLPNPGPLPSPGPLPGPGGALGGLGGLIGLVLDLVTGLLGGLGGSPL